MLGALGGGWQELGEDAGSRSSGKTVGRLGGEVKGGSCIRARRGWVLRDHRQTRVQPNHETGKKVSGEGSRRRGVTLLMTTHGGRDSKQRGGESRLGQRDSGRRHDSGRRRDSVQRCDSGRRRGRLQAAAAAAARSI
jgi:hypothetical protein